MSQLIPRFFPALAGIFVLGLSVEASASDTESLRLQRDLRACIDENITRVNADSLGDVSTVLSACDTELQAFLASISDSTRLEAWRFAISGYVEVNIEPPGVVQDSRG